MRNSSQQYKLCVCCQTNIALEMFGTCKECAREKIAAMRIKITSKKPLDSRGEAWYN